MDELLRRLARKEVFPHLKTIVVAGHSAGGQFLIRYEMLNQLHAKLGVAISYGVANPSSYAYIDSQPAPHGECVSGGGFTHSTGRRSCNYFFKSASVLAFR